MSSSSRHSGGLVWGAGRLAVLAILTALIALGCTADPLTPREVITAPTTFTVYAASPGQVPVGAVYLCYFGNTALEFRTANFAAGTLTWTLDGTARTVWYSDDSSGVDQVTPVLPPGCGVLTLGGWREESEAYTGPSSVTVWITVAPDCWPTC